MARYRERGLEARHEQDSRMLLRDTRTIGQRISDFLSNSFNAMMVFICLGVACILVPMFADLLLVIGICLFIFVYTRKTTLPFRLPQTSHLLDYNDLAPGSNKPKKAGGICYFGNDRATNEELWFSNEDMRTHVLIFGSTGSGKTESMISLAYNALLQASGFIYVDGKGDNTLFAKLFSMARAMGREDDILLINFMTGAKDVFGPQERRLSNTLNPFANGSSSMLAQLVVNLMDTAAATPDGDMWKGRAISFVEALMKVLAYMRDEGHILLDANVIRKYFILERLESIVIDKMFPREGQEAVSLADSPPVVLEPITSYLDNLPGYDKAKKGKQVSQVLEQHGFITMQLTRVFTSLADTYGHILRVPLAEVDMRDVVLNRRILCVLLPALEKSPAELSNLGKVIISTLKAMMSAGLGSEVEGTYRELIKRKPTNAKTPFMCILDEYGYYAVEGFAVVPAQARSLGFAAIFAGQDLPAFQKSSKEEAASIGANTNIKICMKLEDPTETWEFFSKTAGESYVTKVDAFQTNPQSVLNNYLDTRSASSEKRQRIELMDLKEQGMGEAHIFFRSKIIRARMFYANPTLTKNMRLNHFLRVDAPPTAQLVAFEKGAARFNELVEYSDSLLIDAPMTEELSTLVTALHENAEVAPIDRGVAVLVSHHKSQEIPELEEDFMEEEIPFGQLNIFVPLRLSDPTVPMLMGDDFDTFAEAIIDKAAVRSRIEFSERMTGKSRKHAANIAQELINDMQIATHYPPDISGTKMTAAELATIVSGLAFRVKDKAVGGVSDVDDLGGLGEFDDL